MANPFLTSDACPETCRSIGRRNPSIDMEHALLGRIVRCALRPAFDIENVPPVASCVAEGQSERLEVRALN